MENLVARAESNSRAAFRLIEFGHYDEALSLIRNMAEIANLVWLFFIDPTHMRKWLDLREGERQKRYSPVKVRLALESIGSIVPHDEITYRELSRIAAHPDPAVRPQAHNEYGIPTTGGYFQESAYIDSISKLAWTLASVVGPAAKVALLRRDVAESIVNTCRCAIDAIEGLGAQKGEISGSSKRLLDLTTTINETIRKKITD